MRLFPWLTRFQIGEQSHSIGMPRVYPSILASDLITEGKGADIFFEQAGPQTLAKSFGLRQTGRYDFCYRLL